MELRSRKWTFLGLFSVFLALVNLGSLAAQEEQSAQAAGTGNVGRSVGMSENIILVHTYNIRKIYSHRLGFRIDLFDYQGNIRTIYAKISWFANPDQRNINLDTFELAASMNYVPMSSGQPSNYLTLKYEGGRLVAMVIYIDEPNYSRNGIWAQSSPYEDIDSKFNAKTVVFSITPPKPKAAPMPVKKSEDAMSASEETPETKEAAAEQS